MTTHPDFEELLRLLEENDVRYMIVGGYAVAFHGYPRFTKDMDVFFHDSGENISRLRRALLDFGFCESDLSEDIFAEKGNIVQFGAPPVRVDLLNEIDGLAFDEAEKGAVRGSYGNTEVTFIGKRELVRNKKASGRSQDLVDAEKLE